jgi:uncharacterized protein with PIN domain
MTDDWILKAKIICTRCGRTPADFDLRILSVNRPSTHTYLEASLCTGCLEAYWLSEELPSHFELDEGAEIEELCDECQSEISSYRVQVTSVGASRSHVHETLCEDCARRYNLSRLILSRLR